MREWRTENERERERCSEKNYQPDIGRVVSSRTHTYTYTTDIIHSQLIELIINQQVGSSRRHNIVSCMCPYVMCLWAWWAHWKCISSSICIGMWVCVCCAYFFAIQKRTRTKKNKRTYGFERRREQMKRGSEMKRGYAVTRYTIALSTRIWHAFKKSSNV